MAEVSLANEIFDLIFKVMTFLSVMSVLPMEEVVSFLGSPFGASLDWVGGHEKSFLSDLEKSLRPSRVKRGRRWPRQWRLRPVDSSSRGCALNESIESEEIVSNSGAGRAELWEWLVDRAAVMLGVPDLTSFWGVVARQNRVEVWADFPKGGATRVASAEELSRGQAAGAPPWA
ncbi:hypothetical protein BHE74_00002393 [Ensete ventricosum]|nr:hypothetical protein BHE74_00002393 [Ensete ventricosum]